MHHLKSGEMSLSKIFLLIFSDAKSDIWSLGCVIYEVSSLKPPFRANDMDGLYRKV